MCVEWLHSKAFGGPQQTPANVPLSEHHSLVGPPLSLTQCVQWPWLTHCIQPTNRWAALSTGTHRPATLLLSLAALQQFRQHTGELLTLVNALGSPSSLQLLRFWFPTLPALLLRTARRVLPVAPELHGSASLLSTLTPHAIVNSGLHSKRSVGPWWGGRRTWAVYWHAGTLFSAC